ncbi:MAG: SUMF1/EgtB/PvdO family nonheme iron enzyme, partial [Phycisphaerales bacterium]
LPSDEQLGFVEIPGGRFVMGEGKERHEVELSAYAISKHPVTVAQFNAFMKDCGRNKPDEDWEKYNRLDNHPVVLVSWCWLPH